MNKIILMFLTLLFSAGVFAGNDRTCDNGTLSGTYAYEVSGVNKFPFPTATSQTFLTQSTHVVGIVNFNGDGVVKFYGIGSAAGVIRDKTGGGTYKVNNQCTAQGTMVWRNGDIPTTFSIMLDHVDNKPRPFIAYHGFVLATDPNVASGSGSISRVIDGAKHF